MGESGVGEKGGGGGGGGEGGEEAVLVAVGWVKVKCGSKIFTAKIGLCPSV
jgi:hypothetical protein